LFDPKLGSVVRGLEQPHLFKASQEGEGVERK
jgi:hypothetical protein